MKIFWVMILLIPVSLFAQLQVFHKINYEQVEKQVTNENSIFYYPKILKKFVDADTTMSFDEKQLVYYGFVFQDNYNPFETSKYDDRLKELLSNEQFTQKDYEDISNLCDSIIAENPFNLNAYNYQLYALESIGNKDKYSKRVIQIRIVLDAVLSTGDGKTKSNAISVISPAHEYFIIPVLGFEFNGEQALVEHYDMMGISQNSYGIENLFFDVSASLDYIDNSLSE